MFRFIAQILDQILSAVGLASPEVMKRKAIRRLQNELKTEAHTIYRVPGNILLPGFAQAINEFRRLLVPFFDILKNTIDEFSNPEADRYWDYLVELRFDKTILQKKERLSYESIIARSGDGLNIETELQQAGEEFKELINAIHPSAYQAADAELRNLQTLNLLCRHTFEPLLKQFDPHTKIDDPAWKPSFSPIRLQEIVQEIHDLYYVLNGFSPDGSLAAQVAALTLRGNDDRTPPGEMEKTEDLELRLMQLLDRQRKLMQFQLNPGILARILKIAKNDPDFIPNTDSDRFSFIQSYRDRMTERFNKVIERVRRDRKDDAVVMLIQKMFGAAELLPVKGYTETISCELDEAGLGFFTSVLPVRILKSFLYGKYEKTIREISGRLVTEGFFASKNLQTGFAYTVGECEKLLSTYQAFEEELSGDGEASIKTLERVQVEGKQKTQAAMAGKIIAVINENALSLLETEVKTLSRLALHLDDVLQDAKGKNPEKVLNIRTISGASNMHFINALRQAYTDLICFLHLMRLFIHVDEQVFTGLAETIITP